MHLKPLLLFFFFLLITRFALSQPELDINPGRVEFEDLFNRVDYTYLINKGDELLTVDSINYDESVYAIDFENNLQLPLSIVPDDSVKMSVTLTGYYYITSTDTSDTMYVYNNGIESPEPLRVRIDFFEDDYGEFVGTVKDSITTLDSAFIYFFYNGIYLLDTAMTDASGNYQITLPEGKYTIAAERDGYYVIFHDSTYDPFFAKLVNLNDDDSTTINFNLKKITDFGISISGQVFDSLSGGTLNKGMVIVRKGTHVSAPLPKGGSILLDTINTLAGFIKPDGSFTIYMQNPAYYFAQAYTNYFLPGYYNDEGFASVYWQGADSVLINTNVSGKNIFLLNDSSYGNGSIGGTISFSFQRGDMDLEGITLLARNIDNNALYSYNFGKEDGDYNVRNIPYGTYEIVAQKIGIENAISQIVTIDPFNNEIKGINITFNVSDVYEEILPPEEFILYPNYPNPFNPSTTISFYLPKTARVRVNVSNILGETAATLIDEELSQGYHNILFNAEGFASGVYFVTMEAENFLKSQKIVLLK